MAGSSDGPWHLANTPALKLALPNAFFSGFSSSLLRASFNPPNLRMRPPMSGRGRGERATTPPVPISSLKVLNS